MSRFRFLLYLCLLAASLPGAAQQFTLRARVQVLRSGHKLKDASDAVIWLTPASGTVPAPEQTSIPVLEQKHKSFHPGLVVIPVGGKVEFPNHDPFFHNVFSLYEGKRFDLGFYESGTTRFVRFDRPGISYIFCNIHAEMNAVVIALNTPYFGVSTKNGEIAVRNVPAGRYQLNVFHTAVQPADLAAYSREVKVGEGSDFLGNLQLHVTDLIASHKNKYGLDYDPPSPDSDVYIHP